MFKFKSYLMKAKEIIIDMLRDERGSVSIKPVLGFLLGITMGVTLVINTTHPKEYEPSEGLIWGVVAVIIACIGADTVDKFSVKDLIAGTKKKKTEEEGQ